jgi:hypothetical protein
LASIPHAQDARTRCAGVPHLKRPRPGTEADRADGLLPRFDAVYGSSAGALNAAWLLSGRSPTARRGVLAVHCGPGIIFLAVVVWLIRRRVVARSGHANIGATSEIR